MPTNLFSPLTALHRPGQSVQKVVRAVTPIGSPAGVFTVIGKSTFPRSTHTLELIFDSAELTATFMMWYTVQVGALIPFWVPSYQLDMELLGTIAAIDTTFAIKHRGYTEHLYVHTERRAIAFLRANGTFLKRDITGAVDNNDGTETITINAALGEDFVPSRATGICFLWYGRLNDDVARLQWEHDQLCTCAVTMIELLNPPLGGSGEGGPVGGTLPDPGDV